MLSERAREQWSGYVQARGNTTALFDGRDELHRFLVGLHVRGEPLSAADTAVLLDDAGVGDAEERQALADRIDSGLALLAAYEHQLSVEEQTVGDERFGGVEI